MVLEVIERLKELNFAVNHTDDFLIITRGDKSMRILLYELHHHWMEGDMNGLRFSQPSHSADATITNINEIFNHH